MYRKSVRGRGQDQGMPGGFPGQFPGQQSNQPRDGFTQRDYYGGFGQLGAPQPPANQPPANQQYPVPYEDSPEYLNNPPRPAPPQQWQPQAPVPTPAAPEVPPVPPVPSGPQGYRARKLAELDQKYSNGELAMEDYMAQRAEIMKG
ncbi:hypothetical protein HNO80_12170 [Arthrobacter sp. C9C5]|nr:hypothetical protein [Arthrobacter sp. C9C5]NUU32346.1 hypothetical protein [Arthrobacter sp. C9C5]